MNNFQNRSLGPAFYIVAENSSRCVFQIYIYRILQNTKFRKKEN